MSKVVQIVRSVLTRNYLYYDPCTRTAAFHSKQSSENNFIIHEDETHRYLQVYSQPQTVLRVSDDGKISLSMGQAELHTSSQKTNSRVKIYLEGPNGTKYYLRVNPVETAPNRNGNEFTDNDDDGNGITRNENGHAEDETCPRNGLPLQLVDEKFVEKISHQEALTEEVEFDIVPYQVEEMSLTE